MPDKLGGFDRTRRVRERRHVEDTPESGRGESRGLDRALLFAQCIMGKRLTPPLGRLGVGWSVDGLGRACTRSIDRPVVTRASIITSHYCVIEQCDGTHMAVRQGVRRWRLTVERSERVDVCSLELFPIHGSFVRIVVLL